MYKFETHLHTNSCSACAVSTAEEMIDAAKANGYSGVVFTNHFYNGCTCVDKTLPWEDFVDVYANDYYRAKKYGEEKGLKVFFGIEEGYAAGKEMLIYGLSPYTFKKCPDFINYSAKEKSDFVRSNGGLVVCAHPFRKRSYIPDPDTEPPASLFDGVECYNYFNSDEDNQKAFEFAKKNNLLETSGGDIHKSADLGKAGIDFNVPINTYEDFLENIKKGNYTLITK
ncbi:MAG: PHP domain-containing protein [Clostridia bacterium]|nr:PHP domain-containing protein [Clostridia bacterium]